MLPAPGRADQARYAQRVTCPGPTPRTLLTTPTGHLALAMLAVELMAGMQTYLNQTVLPLMATDLGGRDHYGLVTAAAAVPAFLTMPLGAAMLARWRADRLMTALTALLVVGALTGAVAPTIAVYVAGEVLRGLAAGALATVSMGVLVAGLPDAWRRLFLAAGSLMWIVSSVVGPLYASGVSATLGWRWALVAYVPLLVAARLVMAREIRGLAVVADDAAPPWVACLALAGGVGVVGAVPAATVWFWPAAVCGVAAVVWACLRVYPAGVARLAPGRPAAIATLTWVCAVYFALDYLIAPAAHDVLELGAGAIGWALTGAGVCWSLVAAWCGAHPARRAGRYRARTGAGGVLLAAGALLVACALAGPEAATGAQAAVGVSASPSWLPAAPWWCLHLGFAVAGAGMGLTHQDTILRCVTDPVELGGRADGISQATTATAVTVAGSAGGATLGTVVTAAVAPTPAGVEQAAVVSCVVVLAAALALTPLLARRAA